MRVLYNRPIAALEHQRDAFKQCLYSFQTWLRIAVMQPRTMPLSRDADVRSLCVLERPDNAQCTHCFFMNRSLFVVIFVQNVAMVTLPTF